MVKGSWNDIFPEYVALRTLRGVFRRGDNSKFKDGIGAHMLARATVETLSDIQEFIREGLDYFENVHSPEKKERPEFRILIGFGTLIRSLTVVGLPTEGLSGRGEGFDDWSYLRKLRDALGLSDSFLARIKAYRNATAHAEPWTVQIKSPEADSETLRFLVVEVFFALKEWSLTAKARTTSELAASFYRYLSEHNSFVKRLPPAA